jgi:hypothetical protein
MIQRPVSYTKALNRVPQTDSAGYLHENERHTLIPTAGLSCFSAGAMFFFKGQKSVSRNKLEQLVKNRVTLSHGMNRLSCRFLMQ